MAVSREEAAAFGRLLSGEVAHVATDGCGVGKVASASSQRAALWFRHPFCLVALGGWLVLGHLPQHRVFGHQHGSDFPAAAALCTHVSRLGRLPVPPFPSWHHAHRGLASKPSGGLRRVRSTKTDAEGADLRCHCSLIHRPRLVLLGPQGRLRSSPPLDLVLGCRWALQPQEQAWVF